MDQLRHIDTRQRIHTEQKENESTHARQEHASITFTISVSQLRSILGLPPYPLFDPIRDPLPSEPPAVNIDDVDHEQQE
jgi:hypothetical protein